MSLARQGLRWPNWLLRTLTVPGEDRTKKGEIYENVIASKGFGDYHEQFGE
jgi:hypothetical protein